jgi:hypothetical protein
MTSSLSILAAIEHEWKMLCLNIKQKNMLDMLKGLQFHDSCCKDVHQEILYQCSYQAVRILLRCTTVQTVQ